MAGETLTKLRFGVAVGLGLLGACVIWVVAPLNNCLLGGNLVADSYIPEIAVALLAVLVFGLNPLFDRFRAAWRLTRRQLALILGMWLMACVVPGNGLLSAFPYSLATATQTANTDLVLSKAHAQMALPPSLFPDRLAMGQATPVADGLLGHEGPNRPVPWVPWLRTLAAWAPLILGSWLMMVGLGMIVYPQWRERERLSFPLLTMYEVLIQSPEEGRRLGPVLCSRLFWVGALTVLVLHSFNGLNAVTHGGFPPFPLYWNVWQLFQDGMWRNAPIGLRFGKIFFSLIGIVYFMPNRISFSIWFGIVSWAVYVMIRATYFPTATLQEADFRAGAWVAYGVAILCLGRLRWKEVGRAMFATSRDGTVVRDRSAGWIFAAGLGAMFGWFLWAGLPLGASIAYVIFGTLIALLVSRVVCEAGLPLLDAATLFPSTFVSLFPLKWWSASAVYIGGFVGVLFNFGARVGAAAMCCLNMGLDPERPPREQRRIAHVLLLVLVVGVFVAGAVHLKMAYRYDLALDGSSTLSGRGAIRMNAAVSAVKQFHSGSAFTPLPSQRWPSLLGGAALAIGLQLACLAFPGWPLHPISLLFIRSFISDWIMPSIFLGWLIKMLITKYGGAHGYRAARPLFLGLILGEVFAVIVWTLVPAALILAGGDPAEIGRVSILMVR